MIEVRNIFQGFCSGTAEEKAEQRTPTGMMQKTQQSREQDIQGPRDGELGPLYQEGREKWWW